MKGGDIDDESLLRPNVSRAVADEEEDDEMKAAIEESLKIEKKTPHMKDIEPSEDPSNYQRQHS